MEPFGRVIAVSLGGIGFFLLFVFARRSLLLRQKELTVQSLVRECAGRILEERYYTEDRIRSLQEELSGLGHYSIECTVLERVRFENEKGSRELYRVCEAGDRELSSGSLVRIYVTEKRRRAEVFFYGPGSISLAGGRVS